MRLGPGLGKSQFAEATLHQRRLRSPRHCVLCRKTTLGDTLTDVAPRCVQNVAAQLMELDQICYVAGSVGDGDLKRPGLRTRHRGPGALGERRDRDHPRSSQGPGPYRPSGWRICGNHIGEDDPGKINRSYIARRLADDWGFWYAAMTDLGRVKARVDGVAVQPELQRLVDWAGRQLPRSLEGGAGRGSQTYLPRHSPASRGSSGVGLRRPLLLARARVDHLADRAVFSVFRRTAEAPHFRIEKNPKLAAKQGAYSVVDQGGRILKRGADLARVVAVLEKKPKLVDL